MDLTALALTFWLSAAVVLYAYLGYAVLLAVVAKALSRAPQRQPGYRANVSFVLCAHNEGQGISRRIAEISGMLATLGVEGELIVVSDGSVDDTVARAQALTSDRVRVIEFKDRRGKAAALTAGCAAARHEILIFGDCRQRWQPDAMQLLLENFADPQIGAVSGELVLEASPGVMSGVGLYWRYEKWLRQQESRIHSMVGATGAICAVRRQLFRGVPEGTILDDVYWPLTVTMQGYRVVHDKRAVAFDRLPERARDEFRRKVRTLAGNFQLVALLPQSLLPWRNSAWFQFVSHKLLRLVVPWALIAMLITSAILPGPFYQSLFWGQIGFYVLALLGNVRGIGCAIRPAAVAASLLVLNAAAWLAFWVWITGRTGQSWRKVSYREAG